MTILLARGKSYILKNFVGNDKDYNGAKGEYPIPLLSKTPKRTTEYTPLYECTASDQNKGIEDLWIRQTE
jgi:hypothetical protein